MRRRNCLLAGALSAAMCLSLLLTGCGSGAKGGPVGAPAGSGSSGGAVVWNEQADPEPLPDVSFPDASSGAGVEFPNFNPRDTSDLDLSGYVSGDDDQARLDARVFGNLQANGGAGVLGGTTIMVGLNDFYDTFGADGWVVDELATESASMSVIYTNDKYPGATLTLDDGFFDDSDGLEERIATTGFRGYNIDFGKTGHEARPDMHWMGGVTFGASIEEVSGIYLPICEQEYYSYDGDDFSIRSYQLSENYCVWFGFYVGEGLQYVSLRVW